MPQCPAQACHREGAHVKTVNWTASLCGQALGLCSGLRVSPRPLVETCSLVWWLLGGDQVTTAEAS